jgi:hypothetical protein
MLNLKHLVIVLTFIAIECSEINFHESEFCDFFETKNITSGEKFENGTILFEGILYPKGYYRTYNYTLQEKDKTHVSASSHIRGCFCKLVICDLSRFCQLYRCFSRQSFCRNQFG